MTNFLPGIKEKHNYSEKEGSLTQPHFTYVREASHLDLRLKSLVRDLTFFHLAQSHLRCC